jgi:hypothetical protein
VTSLVVSGEFGGSSCVKTINREECGQWQGIDIIFEAAEEGSETSEWSNSNRDESLVLIDDFTNDIIWWYCLRGYGVGTSPWTSKFHFLSIS